MSVLSELGEHFDRLRPEILREPKEDSFIKKPYVVPGGYYEQLWDWDAYFIAHHLARRSENPKPEYFRYLAENFIHAYKELGYPPACITQKKPTKDQERRKFTLKPFLAQAVLNGSAKKNFGWVKEIYDELVEIVTRREKTNRDEKTGLFYWDNAMETGADNNPAVSNSPDLEGLYLACDLNALQYEEYKALSEIAWETGNALHAAQFASAASNIKKALQSHLWNAELGTFDNRRRDTGNFANTITYSNYIPLWLGLGSQEQADSMFQKYLLDGDHMMSPWGCRSLSRQDRCYNNTNIIDPYSNWCGPIWPIANYFYFCALVRYGYLAEAATIARRVGRLVLDDIAVCGSMHENYDAETGKPLAPDKTQSKSGKEGGFIGWNLLVQDMLEDVEAQSAAAPQGLQSGSGMPLNAPVEPETNAETSAPTEDPVTAPARPSVSLEDIKAAFRPKDQKKEEELY